jgi:putative hydrolase of the HAD superfamily
VTRAVFLDALGTLVQLQPPAPRLRRLLAEEGFDVSLERAEAGFAAEIAYYLEHHLDGSDRPSLEDLRDRCASALMAGLELPDLDHSTARWAMLAALEFSAYPDVAPVLARLRADGRVLVIVSNWDLSLPDWLERTGVIARVDHVVTSAAAGAAKPDAAIFEHALEVAGVCREDVVHVGDSLDLDVEGARAAGIRAVLVERGGRPPPGVEAIGSLAELPSLL